MLYSSIGMQWEYVTGDIFLPGIVAEAISQNKMLYLRKLIIRIDTLIEICKTIRLAVLLIYVPERRSMTVENSA